MKETDPVVLKDESHEKFIQFEMDSLVLVDPAQLQRRLSEFNRAEGRVSHPMAMKKRKQHRKKGKNPRAGRWLEAKKSEQEK